jgi:hypothetical protein
MVMSVYLTLKFSSGSEDLKREDERSKTICIPVSLAHQKQMPTLKKLVKLFEKNHCLSIRAVAELADIDKESVRQILHEHLKIVPRILTPERKET